MDAHFRQKHALYVYILGIYTVFVVNFVFAQMQIISYLCSVFWNDYGK